jgi:hypothetical protein
MGQSERSLQGIVSREGSMKTYLYNVVLRDWSTVFQVGSNPEDACSLLKENGIKIRYLILIGEV